MSLARLFPAFLIALAAVLSGCADERTDLSFHTAEDGRIEVEFWHAMSGRQAQSVNEIIDGFNASQETYVVKGVYQGAYNSLSQKLIASLYGGRQPACSQMYESWTTRFLRYGCLQPVDRFIRGDDGFGDADIADIPGPFVEDNSYRMTIGDDGVYRPDPEGERLLATLPFNKSVYLLFVNDTLMREKGFTDPPTTWAELKTLSAAMTDLSNDQYGFAARPFIETFTTMLFAAGTNYMDEEGNFTFSGEAGLDSFEVLHELVLGENRSGYVESAYLNSAFGTGRIGMYIGSTASFPFNDSAVGNKFIWRAYPIPSRDENTEGRALAQGTNIGIFRKGFSENSRVPEEVQRGAWEFMKYMTEREVTAKWAVDTGYLPVRKSAREVPVLKDYLEKNANFANALGEMDRGLFEPKPIWWDSIRNALNREVGSVLNGRKTPEDALESALERASVIRETAGAV